ncbi:MAG: PorP/SprF family type IX secretion system membrane protein, partial [Bacteroidota bacterium]
KLLHTIFLLLAVLHLPAVLSAQDIHFSQPRFSPLNVNPGLAGMFSEDIRIMGSYRSQWQSVPVPYLTFSGAADMKLPNLLRGNENISLAGGILFNHDQAGDSELSLSSFGATGAVHFRINKMNTLSLGVQSSLNQRSFSIAGLLFNAQYNGDILDPTSDNRENFNDDNRAFVDVSAGVSWMLQDAGGRSNVVAGVGVFHLNSPSQSFKDAPDSELPARLTFYASGVAQVHPQWDIVLHALGQIQGPYEQLLLGTAARYHISQAKGKEMAIQVGTSARIGDAIIPTMELHFAQWNVGVSYDINISEFENATNGNGGIEVGVLYTITHVKPVEVFETCPVF